MSLQSVTEYFRNTLVCGLGWPLKINVYIFFTAPTQFLLMSKKIMATKFYINHSILSRAPGHLKLSSFVIFYGKIFILCYNFFFFNQKILNNKHLVRNYTRISKMSLFILLHCLLLR